jgi:murein DD-endopeptidase
MNTTPPFIQQLRNYLKRGEYVITSPFGTRKNPITGKIEFHNGVDLAPVGEVSRWLEIGRPDAVVPLYNDACGLGMGVWYGTTYFGLCHLRSVALTKDRGWVVEVGDTGMVTGVHLHLVIAENSRTWQVGSGAVMDPMRYLK